MENRKIGIVIIILSIILAIILLSFKSQLESPLKKTIADFSGGCPGNMNKETCPHEQMNRILNYTYLFSIVIFIMLVIGIYLTFFEKSQKILKENQEKLFKKLEENKEKEIEEKKFDILLKGLNKDEKEIIKAIKEQDGISQSTLSLRTNIHKSKLSISLGGLGKKGLIKKVKKGKINYLHIKIAL